MKSVSAPGPVETNALENAMRSNQPQTIYLSDYKVPAYLVDTVDLRFELFEDGARVHRGRSRPAKWVPEQSTWMAAE